MIYFSKSTNTFYDDAIHETDQIPRDAVEIKREKHQEILRDHYFGAAISTDEHGHPITVPRVESPEQIKQRVRADAKHALKESDVVVLRCYEEQMQIPTEWMEYRKQLRAVIAGKLGEIPEVPAAL